MGAANKSKILFEETPEQIETRRIQNQTIDEWYQEYDAYFADDPGYTPPKPRVDEEVKKDLYKFESFRTTETGRLVISFISLSNGVVADCFFNVDTKKQRGEGTYQIGANGQFYPQKKIKI